MLAVVFVMLGIFRLWVIEPGARWIVTVLIFPGILTYLFAAIRNKALMELVRRLHAARCGVTVEWEPFLVGVPHRGDFPRRDGSARMLSVVLVGAFAVI